MSEQLAPPLHEIEQEPVHVTSHVAPLVQDALPESPTVTVQSEPSQLTLPLGPVEIEQVLPPEQVAVHDSLHVPLHEAAPLHWSEQLPPALLQLLLCCQVQLAPGQGPPAPFELLEEPQADTMAQVKRTIASKVRFTSLPPGWGGLPCLEKYPDPPGSRHRRGDSSYPGC